MMPKIFISSLSNVNYDHLDEFGTLVREPITTGYIDLTDISKFYKKVRPILAQTTPDDFLAVSGITVVSIVITKFWLDMHGVIRLLSFDKKKGTNGGYVETILTNTSLVPDDAYTTKDDS
jgi:hypothetical protein